MGAGLTVATPRHAVPTISKKLWEQLLSEGKVTDPGNKGKPARGKRKAELAAQSFTAPGTWVVPVLVRSGNNSRGQHAKIARGGQEKLPVYRALARTHREIAPFADAAQAGRPVRCLMTRLGGNLCDDDNLTDAMKYVRDAVSHFLGVDDGPRGPVRWVVAQEAGGPVGVRIELALLEPAA